MPASSSGNEEQRRPMANRTVSDNMIASGSGMRASSSPSNRASTFGSLFRSGHEAYANPASQQRIMPQQAPPPAPSHAYHQQQLPPPLPNPHVASNQSSAPGQLQRPQAGHLQHRPHSTQQLSSFPNPYHSFTSAPPASGSISAPAQQQQYDQNDGNADPLQAALAASRESAAEHSRKLNAEQKAEEEHYRALHESEMAERARKQASDEERMLAEVMEASMREEQETQERRRQEQLEEERQAELLLEESRQHALREEERRTEREHAKLIEESRREAEEQEKRRCMLEAEEKAMEEAAIQESLKQMKVEWQRREEEEQAVATYMQHGGTLGGASYWQHLDQMAAYNLAVKMDKRADLQTSTVPTRRRPLPPTPGMAAMAAGVEARKDAPSAGRIEEEAEEDDVWVQSEDEFAADGKDPFSDEAEAPPGYDDVREDRPPEAPEVIPTHIRFEPLTNPYQADHSNTITSVQPPPEKSAAYMQDSQQQDEQRQERQHNEVIGEANDRLASSSRLLPPLPQIEELRLAEASFASSTVEESHSPTADETSVPQTPSAESAAEFLQRTMKGTDFGYAEEPFGTSLTSSATGDDGDGDGKSHFPNMIQLRKLDIEGRLHDPSCFFVIRAPSWKALLRALAWYGNTRLEAGPEEIADYGDGVPLRIEVEFVTPTKIDVDAGVRNAHVGVCISLAVPSLADGSSSELRKALKQSSRALDAAYLRQGSTRRVIALPSQAPVLPLDMVRLAQHMHRAYTFSAACPSTGATALHSPRDLHHAVERHDGGFVAKMQRKRKAQQVGVSGGEGGMGSAPSGSALAGPPTSAGHAGPSTTKTSINDRKTSTASRKSGIMGLSSTTDEKGGARHGQEGDETDEEEDIFDAGAVEVADGTDRDHSRMSRMRARVRRKLAKRAGDSRLVDEDLESWITPYDMTNHG